MTVLEVVLLCLGGMPLFDSLIHSFGSAGTGGFSSRALSVGAYNSPYANGSSVSSIRISIHAAVRHQL